MDIHKINKIFEILDGEFSLKRDTELQYHNHYQLLIAIILSAQATDNSVNKIAKPLFSALTKPEDAITLGVNAINGYIKTINYHNVKAEYIYKMSQMIIQKFNGNIPQNFNDLVQLPGVGRKTANVFLSVAFQKPNIAVDTHVFRVSNRIGITKAKNVLQTEMQLTKNVPLQLHRQINPLLISFGRKYCKAIKPKCNECPIKQYCKEYQQNKKN